MPDVVPFVVAPSAGVPIYRQLVEQARANVAGGRWTAGDFLPSVRTVAEQLAINPMTVSKAYSLLERDGVVEFVRGQGMRINHPGPAATARNRRAALLPLLKQVAQTAGQLSLSPEQVLTDLRKLLEEPHDRD